MAKLGRIYFLVATRKTGGGAWKRTPTEVKTKKHATERMAAWRRHHESAGWQIEKVGDYLVARKDEEARSIGLHEYDAETHERIYMHGGATWRIAIGGEIVWEKRSKKRAPAEPVAIRPRSGRKPAYA